MRRQSTSDQKLLSGLFFRLLPYQVLLIVISAVNGTVILRIRDNCAAFNPSERARAMEPDDVGKNVGIRLVYGIAESVSYQNLLGLNVLTMRI